MSSFFKKFPTVQYDFDRNGILQSMTDIFRHVKPLDNFIDESLVYRFYEIEDGERPDIVSEKIYGTANYYWTFFVVNERLHDGYREWPMSQIDFSEYLDKKYEGVAIVPGRPSVSVNTDGLVISANNSLGGRFTIGETITGQTSNATGTLVQKNVDMHQIVCQNVSGNFLGDASAVEVVKGNTSGDTVDTFKIYNYIDAPYQYYHQNDAEKRAVSYSNAFQDTSAGRASTVDEVNIKFITNRQHENELNDDRAFIRYIDPQYIQDFVRKYENLINE
tara:strand:- start:1614 stop:2441 length:828 start_codon:yes stop_codon:yes gene_type:complete